jgi:S-DNA-T family DNA segregation ATPase FtsK/SpoIIIE
MTDNDEQPVPSAWRVDALVLTLAAVGGLLGVAVGTAKGLGAGPNAFGPWGDRAAAWLLEPVGWAAVVLLAGWFALAALLVRNRAPLRLAVRTSGWCFATATAAVGADWFGRGLTLPSVAGRGGSVGAYLRFALEDATEPTSALVVFGLAVVASVLLVADWFVVRIALGVWAVLRAVWGGAVWTNDRVGDAMEAVLTRVGRGLTFIARRAAGLTRRALAALPKRQPAPPVSPTAAPHIPITKMPVPTPVSVATQTPPPMRALPPLALAPDTVPGAEPEPNPESIPIHVHAGPKPSLLLHAAPPPDEQLSNVDYELPPLSLLNDPEPFPVEDHEQKLREMAVLLEKTFQDFGLTVKVVGIHTGPVITQYEISLETGTRLNKITTLADDLALNLRVASVRVVAPLPGRNTVGIEVPNEIRQTVQLKELVAALAPTPKVSKFRLPLFIGKDVEGRPLAYDLATMPHLLIAGSTGTGKSVCLNTIIVSCCSRAGRTSAG